MCSEHNTLNISWILINNLDLSVRGHIKDLQNRAKCSSHIVQKFLEEVQQMILLQVHLSMIHFEWSTTWRNFEWCPVINFGCCLEPTLEIIIWWYYESPFVGGWVGCGFIPVWLTRAACFRQASGVGLMAFLYEGKSWKRGDDRWMGPATALGTEAVGVGGSGCWRQWRLVWAWRMQPLQ